MKSQFYTNKERSTGILNCSCNGLDHFVALNHDDEPDFYEDWFLTVNLGAINNWKEKFQFIWHIIKHNEYYASEVLSLETVKDFHKWLGEKIAVAESKTKQ